jgi:hypothetical protein
MNWQTFQHHGEAPARAFEAFVTHLFERWCVRTFGDRLRRQHALDGKGGDGGVEAFAVLTDDSEVGLQAKWFHGGFDGARVKKIQNSLTQARARHPAMCRYFVCLPNDLMDSKAARQQKSELDRWGDLVAWAHQTHAGVELEYWGNTKLEARLAEIDDGSISAYWFGKDALRAADVTAMFQATLEAHFRERYLPDLHQTGRIDEVIDDHLRTTESRAREAMSLRQAVKGVRLAADEVRRLSRLPDAPLQVDAVRRAATNTLSYLDHVLSFAGALAIKVASGGLRSATEDFSPPPTPEEVAKLVRLLDERDSRSTGYASSHACLVALKGLRRPLRAIDELAYRVRQSGRPLLVAGAPGVGKLRGYRLCGRAVADRRRSARRPHNRVQAGSPRQHRRRQKGVSGRCILIREWRRRRSAVRRRSLEWRTDKCAGASRL